MDKIKKIVIVGGGSSGWISASYIMKALNFNIDITLIESPNIQRIGVGEATIPTIKEELFDFLEIQEEEWMPFCKASYKLGIKYVNWKKSPEQGGDHYYHSFGELPTCKSIPLSQIWMYKRHNGFKKPHDYSCYISPQICDEYKAPRYMDGTKAVHYAYHFDALDIADFLSNWCITRGLDHKKEEIVKVNLDDDGNISSLLGQNGSIYEADLFIDCSGFQGLLIEKALKEPHVSFTDSLFTDSAVAFNVPFDAEKEGIRPYTTATAFSCGWQWQIPVFGRIGTGYVYSSAFQSSESAEIEMRNYFGKSVENLDAKHIKFKSGRRRRSWVKNCISFGLSSSFLEPLESTGLYFVYAALYQFIQYFPKKKIEQALVDQFNEKVAYMVEDVRDFIVMHFHTAQREDTEYWKANKYDLKVPDSLKRILELQKAGAQIKKSFANDANLYSSFEAGFERFWTNSNYQSVLAGVEYLPNQYLSLLDHRADILSEAEGIFANVELQSRLISERLPSQYDYLKQLYSQANILSI